ncbi:MAG: TolC family protein [Planctomycetes bacterium]|nr:TolC family protein [Planctomycetota bacterium]
MFNIVGKYSKLAAAALILSVAGCQSYERQPLNAEEHLGEWRGRSGKSSELQKFVNNLQGESVVANFNLDDGVSLAEAEIVALFFNAELRIARLEADSEIAGARESGRWEDPEFGISGSWILQNVSNPLTLGVGFSFTIPLSGRLGVQEDLAFASANVALQEILLKEWHTLINLRVLWREAAALSCHIGALAEFLSVIEGVETRAKMLRDAGELNAASARLFEITRQETLLESAVLQRRLERISLEIKALMGFSPSAVISIAPEFGAISTNALSADLLTNNPQIELLRRSYEVSEQQLRLEIHKQYPDLTIGPGYEFDEGQSSIGLGLGIPIPFWNANVEGIARARGARNVALAYFEAIVESQFSELEQAKHDIESANLQLKTLQDIVAPLVEKQVNEARDLANLGEFDAMLQLEALSSLHQTKLRIIEAFRFRADAIDSLTALSGPINKAPKVSAETVEEE